MQGKEYEKLKEVLKSEFRATTGKEFTKVYYAGQHLHVPTVEFTRALEEVKKEFEEISELVEIVIKLSKNNGNRKRISEFLNKGVWNG